MGHFQVDFVLTMSCNTNFVGSWFWVLYMNPSLISGTEFCNFRTRSSTKFRFLLLDVSWSNAISIYKSVVLKPIIKTFKESWKSLVFITDLDSKKKSITCTTKFKFHKFEFRILRSNLIFAPFSFGPEDLWMTLWIYIYRYALHSYDRIWKKFIT